MKYLAIIPLLFLLVGCELLLEPPAEGKVTHVAIALNYEGTNVNTLNGTIHDAVEQEAAFRELFLQREHTGYLLLQRGKEDGSYDDLSSPFLPTMERVKTLIASLVEEQQAQDLLIITYSGHGLEDGSWVLAPDTEDGAIFLPNNSIDPSILLSVDELFSILAPSKGTTLLIIDSCYAGNFVKESNTSISLISQRSIISDAYETYFNTQNPETSVFVMAATTADNTSKEPANGSHIHGYFTQALLAGIGWDEETQSLIRTPSSISLDDLYRYIIENQHFPIEGTVKELYQHPTISGGSMDLVLVQEEN